MTPANIQGQRFGRWLVIADLGYGRSNGGNKVHCRCDCGVDRWVNRDSVRRGGTLSCGCLTREVNARMRAEENRTHGDSATAIYKIWVGMVQRCERKRAISYPRYGGRGISVCTRWRESFEAFRDDVGPRPSPEHTIDRIDGDGNYEPGNVRWSDWKQQNRHTSGTHVLEHGGERLCISEWAEKTGIPAPVIGYRIRSGWSVERALTQPKQAYAFKGAS